LKNPPEATAFQLDWPNFVQKYVLYIRILEHFLQSLFPECKGGSGKYIMSIIEPFLKLTQIMPGQQSQQACFSIGQPDQLIADKG